MSEQKKKSGFPIALIVIVVIAAAGLAAYSANQKPTNTTTDVAAIQPAEGTSDTPAPAPTEQQAATPEAKAPTPETTIAAPAAAATAPDDLAALTTPRILGNPEAPLKISEHSSFTCGACAAYHQTNFKKIKADYIDTGKAYLVFDDFPRNEVDVFVGSLARCLSGDAYFNFIQLLFETQSEWVNEGYKAHVKQNAMIAGLSDERAEECLNNKAVHEALAASRQAAQDKFNINSTPNLVLDDQKVIPGLTPYDELQKAFDEELAKKGK